MSDRDDQPRTPPSVDVDALVQCASCLRDVDEPGPDDVCASCYRADG